MVIRTRFAPSPTGYMHLGNAWVAFLNWLWTRQQGGQVVLRIEDIDRERCHTEYVEALEEDLSFLGLTWDEGPGHTYGYGEPVQSLRTSLYESVLERFEKAGDLYPCYCTRARIHSIASAPHEGEGLPVYDGHCRNLTVEERAAMTKTPSWRLKMETRTETFNDLLSGMHSLTLEKGADDFVLRRADGMFAYQLAVSVDDGAMGITHVFRGNDLFSSTYYQCFLLEKLGYPVPVYCHLPLLVDKTGVRLSKRQHGITIRALRRAGYTAADIIGCLLYWAGAFTTFRPMTAEEAVKEVPFSRLSCLGKKHIIVEV